ncbi:NUDIX domain-containing protein [Mucilaginibacter sp. CAU 1740]|uniref:NUDIX hydrolase n=1 Tax=Mucilaginibacter sp. CAU 1740 TaxID=3140365 RepID=UPI00325C083C
MAQKYRIYINEKVILITESEPKHADNFEKLDAETFDLKIIYTWILANPNKLFYIKTANAKVYFKAVKKSITLIEAAGGLVMNTKGQYLFIYRNDKWDLPKGKIEKDEGVKEAAVREVEEECGIKVSELNEKICKTYHVYVNRGEVVLKKTYWYAMKSKAKDKLKPQKEEGITDVRWFEKEHIEPIIENTFPSIMDVLHKEKLVTNKVMPLSE